MCIFYCIIEYLIFNGAHPTEFFKNSQNGAKDGIIIKAICYIIKAIHLLTHLNSHSIYNILSYQLLIGFQDLHMKLPWTLVGKKIKKEKEQ